MANLGHPTVCISRITFVSVVYTYCRLICTYPQLKHYLRFPPPFPHPLRHPAVKRGDFVIVFFLAGVYREGDCPVVAAHGQVEIHEGEQGGLLFRGEKEVGVVSVDRKQEFSGECFVVVEEGSTDVLWIEVCGGPFPACT